MPMQFDYLGNMLKEEDELGPLIASSDPSLVAMNEPKSFFPQAKSFGQEMPQKQEPLNPMIKEYLMKPKLDLSGYGDEDRKKLLEENQSGFGDKAQAALAALGAGFMGRDAGSAGNAVLSRQKGERDSKLSEFDQARQNKIQQYGLDREVLKNEKDDETMARESDPMSQESSLAQTLARKMLPSKDFSGMSAAQINKMIPSMSKIYEIEKDKEMKRLALQEKQGLSEAELAVDKKYAGDYVDFSGKGEVNARQTIEQLRELKNELDKESKKTFQSGGGRITPILPDMFRDVDSLRWKTEIPAKANLVLKDLFGGQLSDAERKSEAETYYNDMLGPEENSKILGKKIDTMEKQLAAESARARHYEKNRTLKGYGRNGQTGSRDPDAERYASMHGIDYDKALGIINARRSKTQIAGGR